MQCLPEEEKLATGSYPLLAPSLPCLNLKKMVSLPEKILEVVGYADNFPLFKDNPYDAKNRRITLTAHYGPPEGFKAKVEKTTNSTP